MPAVDQHDGRGLAHPHPGGPSAGQHRVINTVFHDVAHCNSATRGDAMAVKFEISKDHAGKFRFHLKAPNGEIIAASQGYETKVSAEKGIEPIKTHAPNAKVEDH
jgi:uncharacterized protein YegP (UPF0339 family)